jgi:hypothetical protein
MLKRPSVLRGLSLGGRLAVGRGGLLSRVRTNKERRTVDSGRPRRYAQLIKLTLETVHAAFQ